MSGVTLHQCPSAAAQGCAPIANLISPPSVSCDLHLSAHVRNHAGGDAHIKSTQTSLQELDRRCGKTEA